MKIHLLVLLSLCVVASLIAGCATPPAAAPAAQPTAAPAQPTTASAKPCTITFGAAVSLTGATAKEGEYVKNGYNMFIEDVNKEGGFKVGSQKCTLVLKIYDDESNADTSAKLIEKLVTEDKVNLLLGPYGTGPVFSASAIAEKYDVPMVEPGGAGMKIFTRGFKNVWGTLPAAPNYLNSAVDMIMARDPSAKNVALFIENDSFSQEVADGITAYLKQKGLNLVYSEQYPKGTKDVSSLATAAKAKNPDIVLGASHLADAELVVKQAKDIGLNAKAWAFSVGPSTAEFGTALGKDATYILGVTPWTPAMKFQGQDIYGTPQKFADAFKAKYGYVPSYHSASAVATMIAFQKAIEAAGSIDPKAVREQLNKLDVPTFYGQLKFSPEGIIVKPMGVVQWFDDGKMYTIWPKEVAEKDFVYPAPAWDKR
jgi:branched-chain amino acid transport system substrate-binding protein